MLYAFFSAIPRRMNSDTGELPRRKHTIKILAYFDTEDHCTGVRPSSGFLVATML
jgi:hypothetical protein